MTLEEAIEEAMIQHRREQEDPVIRARKPRKLSATVMLPFLQELAKLRRETEKRRAFPKLPDTGQAIHRLANGANPDGDPETSCASVRALVEAGWDVRAIIGDDGLTVKAHPETVDALRNKDLL